MDDQMNEFR